MGTQRVREQRKNSKLYRRKEVEIIFSNNYTLLCGKAININSIILMSTLNIQIQIAHLWVKWQNIFKHLCIKAEGWVISGRRKQPSWSIISRHCERDASQGLAKTVLKAGSMYFLSSFRKSIGKNTESADLRKANLNFIKTKTSSNDIDLSPIY